MTVQMSRTVRRHAVQLGEYFTAWRKVLNLTTSQVADRAGVARGTLRAIERGTGTASLSATLQVAQALGVLDKLTEAVDPFKTDLGRLRAGLINRQRVR
jgi:transcriptional regulator with XRE-family HTH domain